MHCELSKSRSSTYVGEIFHINVNYAETLSHQHRISTAQSLSSKFSITAIGYTDLASHPACLNSAHPQIKIY